MRVGLVTTWNERCGLAAYSQNVASNLPGVGWRIIARDEWGDDFANVPRIARECDLTHIMHHGGLMASMSPEIVRSCGKTVITRQCTGTEAVFNAANIKTAHVEMPGYRFIPHGVLDVPLPVYVPGELSIGCAGIPFDGKGHWEAVQIAKMTGATVRLVVPDSPHTPQLGDHYKRICDDHGVKWQIKTGWPSEEEVVRWLSSSTVNIFFYTRQANGISGAVRLGISALRPVIVSDHSQFQDVIKHGGVNVADSLEHAAQMVQEYRDPGIQLRVPHTIVGDWSYRETAKMYYSVYKEVLGMP